MTDLSAATTGLVIAGRYELVARRGSVADGAIFEATDLQQERVVDLKLLSADIVKNPELNRAFRRLANQLTELNHPNIVSVYDFGVATVGDARLPYLVTEHLPGGNLRTIIDRGRKLTPSQAVVVGLDACRGLDHLHRRGAIHSEIRPENLVFGDDRRLRLDNLGLAGLNAAAHGFAVSDLDINVARYTSPEQALRQGITAKTDVYSLTLCLVESITGQVPFGGDTTSSTLNNRIDKLLPVSADLGPLASVFEHAGRPDPTERSSAAELGRDMMQVASTLPRPTPLPLANTGPSLFEAPAGQETTSELTRFRDPTGALLIPNAEDLDPSGSVRQPGAGPAVTQRQDVTNPTQRSAGAARQRVVRVDQTGDGPQTAGSKRPIPLYLTIALGLIVASILAVVAFHKLATPTYSVPNLVGLDEGAARNIVAGNGWKIVVQPQADDSQPAGKIFKTSPAVGIRLQKAKSLVLYVSTGATLATLPDITGKLLADVKPAVLALGLTLSTSEVFDEVVPAGAIISWSVPAQPALVAGAQVVKGTALTAVLSKGAAPRKVPLLVGLTLDVATAQLTAMQLTIVNDADVFDDAAAGTVIAQGTPAKTGVDRGTVIHVQVSKGPDLVVVPALTGTLTDITNALNAAGLTVGTVAGDPTLALLAASSKAKPVVAGAQLKRGSAVDLTFDIPPPPTTLAAAPPST
jgi:eukaryotic-like serine/threonine-protein kinase